MAHIGFSQGLGFKVYGFPLSEALKMSKQGVFLHTLGVHVIPLYMM